MNVLRALFPHEYVDSVASIDFDKLYRIGYRGLMFDIDNTLVHHGEDATDEVKDLFTRLDGIGYKAVVLTDNSEARTRRFLTNIDCPYVCGANKPDARGFFEALSILGTKKEETIVIGDQIFRDILGANRSGISSILVEYLRYENETKIGIRRSIEKVVLRLYALDKWSQHRLGGVYEEIVG